MAALEQNGYIDDSVKKRQINICERMCRYVLGLRDSALIQKLVLGEVKLPESDEPVEVIKALRVFLADHIKGVSEELYQACFSGSYDEGVESSLEHQFKVRKDTLEELMPNLKKLEKTQSGRESLKVLAGWTPYIFSVSWEAYQHHDNAVFKNLTPDSALAVILNAKKSSGQFSVHFVQSLHQTVLYKLLTLFSFTGIKGVEHIADRLSEAEFERAGLCHVTESSAKAGVLSFYATLWELRKVINQYWIVLASPGIEWRFHEHPVVELILNLSALQKSKNRELPPAMQNALGELRDLNLAVKSEVFAATSRIKKEAYALQEFILGFQDPETRGLWLVNEGNVVSGLKRVELSQDERVLVGHKDIPHSKRYVPSFFVLNYLDSLSAEAKLSPHERLLFKLVLTARSNSWDGVLESFLATCSPLNLDAQDQWGKTALRWAVELQDEATVRALLLLGANPDIKDCCGYSPRAIAKLWLTPLGDHWRAPGESNNSKNILDALEQASVDVWDASQKRLNPVSVSKTIHPALASFLTATETALISYGKNFSNPMGQKSVVALLELRRYFSVFSMELRRGGITKIFEKPIQQLIDQKFKCFFDVSQKLNSCLMKHDWIGSNEQKVDNDQTSLFVEALKRWKTGKPSKAVLSEDEAYVMEAVCFSLATSPVEDLKGNQAMLAHLLAQDDPGVGLRLINWLGVLKERAMNWSSNNPAYNFFVRNSGHRERIYRIVAAANDQLTEAESKALLKALGVEETLLPSEQSALAQASAGSPPSSDKSSTKSENYVERVIREDAERRAMEGLIDVIRFMRVSSTESGMGGRDRFISALNWLLETGKPKVDWRNPKFYEDMTSHSPLLALFSTPYVWGHLEPDEKRIILTRLYAVFSKQVHEGKTCEIEAFLPFISALEKDVLAIESSDENLGKLRFIIEQHRALAAAFPVHDMPRANSASAQKLLGQNQRAFPGELPAISDTLNGFFYLLMLQLCLRGQSIDREATFGYFFLAFQEDSLCKPASLQDLQRRLQEIPAPEPKNAKLIWAQWKRGVEPGRLAEMLLTHMRLGNLMWVHQLLLEGATPRAIDAYGENLYQVAQTAYLNVPSTMHDQKILFNQILNLVESASPIEVLLRKGKESSQQDFEEFIERKKSGYQQYPETQKVLEHMLTAIVQAMAIYLTRYEREVKTLFESSSYQAADECRRYLELMPSVLWRIKEKLLEPRVLEDILKEVAMRVEAMLKSGRNLPALIRERFQESAPAAFDGVAESKSDGDESFLDRVQNVIQMRMNNSIRRHATTATVVSSLTATPVATSSLHAARM